MTSYSNCLVSVTLEKNSYNVQLNNIIIIIIIIIIIAMHLSAHLKFSMHLQREAKTLNHLHNLR